eukprot:2261317-Pleurochrysis_carterae.AAC.1
MKRSLLCRPAIRGSPQPTNLSGDGLSSRRSSFWHDTTVMRSTHHIVRQKMGCVKGGRHGERAAAAACLGRAADSQVSRMVCRAVGTPSELQCVAARDLNQADPGRVFSWSGSSDASEGVAILLFLLAPPARASDSKTSPSLARRRVSSRAQGVTR